MSSIAQQGLCLGMDNFNHLVSELEFGFGVVALSLARVSKGRYNMVSE
jgi:hypothetical protein